MDFKINERLVDLYRKRLRILLIIYYFSNKIDKSTYPKVLKGEMKIQKIDFLIRYPDYLAYELLEIIDYSNQKEIQRIVLSIFNQNEPVIRKDEMEKFIFGAFEGIDDAIAFLEGVGLIHFNGQRHTDGKVGQKLYYLTNLGQEKIEKGLANFPSIRWYFERCKLIKKYFGDFSGKELRIMQYKHLEYSNTPYREYIKSIEDKVRIRYSELFKIQLP